MDFQARGTAEGNLNYDITDFMENDLLMEKVMVTVKKNNKETAK